MGFSCIHIGIETNVWKGVPKECAARSRSSELRGIGDVGDVTLRARGIVLLWEQPVQKAGHCIGFSASSGLEWTNSYGFILLEFLEAGSIFLCKGEIEDCRGCAVRMFFLYSTKLVIMLLDYARSWSWAVVLQEGYCVLAYMQM